MVSTWRMVVTLMIACCVMITTEAANGQSDYVTNDTVSLSLPENIAVLSVVIDLSTFVVGNETSSPSPGNDVTTPIPTQTVTNTNDSINSTRNGTTNANGTTNGTTNTNGTSNEATSNYKFSLLSGNTHNRFAVSEDSGVLTLVRPLDVTVDRRYDLNVSVHLLQKNVTAFITVTVDVNDVEGYPPVFNDNCRTPVVDDDKGVVVDTKLGYRIAAFAPGSEFTNADFFFDPNAVVKISTDNDQCGLEYADVFIAQDPFFAHLVNDSQIVCGDPDGGNQEGSKMTIDVIRPPFSPADPLQHKIHPATWSLMFQDSWVRDNSPFVVLDMAIDNVSSRKKSSWICFGTQDAARFEVKLDISARGCSEGKYGGLCDQTCVCQNGATCHAFNGACLCGPGWKGVACDIPNHENLMLTIREDQIVGSTVLDMNGVLVANGFLRNQTAEARFTLLSGNKHQRFTLSEDTGLLSLSRPLDVTVDNQYVLNVTVLQNNITSFITVTVDVNDVEGYPPVFNDNCRTPVVDDDKGVVVETNLGYRIAAFAPGADFTDADFFFDPNAVVKISTENDHCGLEYADVFIAQDFFFAHLVNDSQIVCADSDGGNQEGSKMTIDVIRPPFSPADPLQHKIHPATWSLMFQDSWVQDNSPFVVLDMAIDRVLSGQNSSYVCVGTNDTAGFEVKLDISARGCSEGKYGGLCDQTCVCQNGATCHAFNGACLCAPGWKGVACDIPNPTVLVTASKPSPKPGDDINITCHSYNIRADSLTWTKDGKGVPDGTIMKSSFYSNHVLVIPQLSKEHGGEYQCIVRDVNGVETRAVYSLNVPPKPGKSLSPGIIAIAVLVPAAVLCVAGVGAYLFMRKKKEAKYRMDSELISWLHDPENKDVIRKWERKRQDLTIVEQIGQGQFCYVVKAKLRMQASQHTVAAKTIRADQAGEVVQRDFLRETKLLSDLHLPQDASSSPSVNQNIIQFYGYVLDKARVYLLVEYAPYGDLRNYLSSCRHRCQSSGPLGVTAEQDREFLRFARGVANALAELKRKKVVHRDVAARNVLISADREAKICDFGLARDIYTESEYVKLTNQQGDDGPLPIRWMALESLQDGAFTYKTDIWSYGILLWEIASLGGRPYPGLSADKQLIDWLSAGKRMDQLDSCPDHMHNVMQKCWLKDPAARPDPTDLVQDMDNLVNSSEEANHHQTYFFTESCHSPPESSAYMNMV